MKKLLLYSMLTLVSVNQTITILSAEDTKPVELSEHQKAELRKRGMQCFAGSIACAIYAYGNRHQLPHAFRNWRTAPMTLDVNLVRGLQNAPHLGVIPSEAGRVLLGALGSMHLAVYGALCFLKPEFITQMHAKFATK